MKSIFRGAAYPLIIIGLTVIASIFYWARLLDSQKAEIEAARHLGELQVAQINQAVDQQMDATLRSVDIALRHLRNVYLHNRKDLNRSVQDVLAAYPNKMLDYVVVIRADGYVAYSSTDQAGAKSTHVFLGDREHFLVHAKSNEDRLFISKPIIGRLTGIELVQLTRPIWEGNRFVGVIGIPLRPDYISKNLWSLHIDQNDVISILRDDGNFISRSRNLVAAQKLKMPDDRPFMHSHPGEHGVFRNFSVIDKIPMLFSWRHLASWPVIAVTAIDENSELTGVLNNQSASRKRTLLAIALFLSFSIWVSALFSRISRKSHELSLSEARFRNLLENAPNAMVSIDPGNGRLMQANQIALKMWGYGIEEFLTKTKDDITYPDDLAESQIRNEQLANGVLDTARFEKRYLKKDGSYFWGETCVSTMKDDTGKVNLFIGSTIDITDRKKTEQALNRESAKNLALLLNASDGIHILDIEGNVIEASNSFCVMLGYQHDEMIGMNVRQWDAQFSDSELPQVICEHSNRQTQFQFETTHRRKDGSIFNVEISGIPILLDGKTVTFYSSRDITERKRTERILSELSAHLQVVREEEKSKFAREIHDELSGTLAALKMDASWLASKIPATTAMLPLQNCAKSMGNLIENAAVAMRRIITDLRPPMLNELGLIETFKWQCADFQKRSGIKCKITCFETKDLDCKDSQHCERNFDGMLSIHLYRIFQETLSNVARHSGATSVDAEFEVGKNEVRLSVRDNGCGLPENYLIAPTSFGILGMHERVGQLNGKIKFDNHPGKGLTVTVILPI